MLADNRKIPRRTGSPSRPPSPTRRRCWREPRRPEAAPQGRPEQPRRRLQDRRGDGRSPAPGDPGPRRPRRDHPAAGRRAGERRRRRVRRPLGRPLSSGRLFGRREPSPPPPARRGVRLRRPRPLCAGAAFVGTFRRCATGSGCPKGRGTSCRRCGGRGAQWGTDELVEAPGAWPAGLGASTPVAPSIGTSRRGGATCPPPVARERPRRRPIFCRARRPGPLVRPAS